MAHLSIHFKTNEQDRLILYRAMNFYYKQIGEEEKFNASEIMKDALFDLLEEKKKKLKDKGINIIKLYKEYEQKRDEIAWKVKTETKYPEGQSIIEEKLKDFDE